MGAMFSRRQREREMASRQWLTKRHFSTSGKMLSSSKKELMWQPQRPHGTTLTKMLPLIPRKIGQASRIRRQKLQQKCHQQESEARQRLRSKQQGKSRHLPHHQHPEPPSAKTPQRLKVQQVSLQPNLQQQQQHQPLRLQQLKQH